jgi:hypothetical protein
MSWQRVSVGKALGLVAAVLLVTGPAVLAGEHYHTPPAAQHPAPPPPAPTPRFAVVAAPSVAVVVSTQPRPAPYYVSIRGLDGQVRRFAVEGSPAAIRTASVIVLRPGASVTLTWVAAR